MPGMKISHDAITAPGRDWPVWRHMERMARATRQSRENHMPATFDGGEANQRTGVALPRESGYGALAYPPDKA